ncbi:hypothetical protein OHA40_32220 [Nocardia sp. NBC_00508]|uniref:hypothetical protein n=1 Tax=Nocardia sp. NBC_00508 TaxID=2975992 RepID=UPI002E818FA2|nr:hypothetical protein [Nocardia sp. NBC_00508]WUD66172.1 hypothetical protein OHA40_32220 [Nocardia sp. NBC_00508]
MGEQLHRYVLPKVPELDLRDVQAIKVYGSPSLALLLNAKPLDSKLFNWRRPEFIRLGGFLHCVASPGRDYTWHYAKLIATAGLIRGQQRPVVLTQPRRYEVERFIDRWLPLSLPDADLVILGYVQHLFRQEAESVPWTHCHGFGWKRIEVAGATVLLLGCEFSYWGDLSGSLTAAILRRGITSWVMYVGKLGALDPSLAPNQWLATGQSSVVDGVPFGWQGRLQYVRPTGRTLRDICHVTMPSVIDETREWAVEASQSSQVVDPEIGHMGRAAVKAGASFDYLHLVTDNLVKDFGQGLYDERLKRVASQRKSLVMEAEQMIRRSIVQTC